jgi:methionine-S-sulfoxide reductase
VVSTRVGYAGGAKVYPTYHDLGDHGETIQIDFDSQIISYEELLDIFWRSHIPEYNAPSRQYASMVFYHDEKQREKALKSKEREEVRKKTKIFTEIGELEKFYLAENYHQKHYLQLVRELMNEFSSMYTNFTDFINSTSAAHVNGYIKGYGSKEMLNKEIYTLGLSEKGQKRLVQIVEGYGR